MSRLTSSGGNVSTPDPVVTSTAPGGPPATLGAICSGPSDNSGPVRLSPQPATQRHEHQDGRNGFEVTHDSLLTTRYDRATVTKHLQT